MSATFLRKLEPQIITWCKPPRELERAEWRCGCGKVFECYRGTGDDGEREDALCLECDRKRDLEKQAARDIERLAARTLESIPQRFRWASFDSPDLPRRVRPPSMIERARQALSARKNVFLLGNAGMGKTCLGVALLRAFSAELKRTGRFATTFDIAEARRQAKLGTGEAESIRHAEHATVLLLDEVAAEQSRDLAVDEVVRHRHDHELLTIFTSGFSREEIAQKYGGGVERRLFEGALVLQLGGK